LLGVTDLVFRVSGLEFGVYGLRFRGLGLGTRIEAFRDWGLGSRSNVRMSASASLTALVSEFEVTDSELGVTHPNP